jgi:ABC-type tungstate transport system permease subunit
LASIAAQEQLEKERVQKIAIGTGTAVAIGLAAGVASLLLKRP